MMQAFIPRGMSLEERTQGCAELTRASYSRGALLQRIVDPDSLGKKPLAPRIFTVGNLMLRQEVYARLGYPFVHRQP